MNGRLIGYVTGWLIGGFGLAGLLAPPIYWLLTSLSHVGILPAGGAIVFERVLRRCLSLVALLGLLYWFKAMPVERRALQIGWSDPHWLRHVMLSTLLSMVSLGLGLVGVWHAGWLHWSHWPTGLDVVGAIALAVSVAVFEETLFRGALFGWLYRQASLVVACLLGTILFVVPHFLHLPAQAAKHVLGIDVIRWDTGLRLLPVLFAPLQNLSALWPHGLCLLVLANSCHWLVVRTGSVAAAIGFHGGLLFALKLAQVSLFVSAPSYWLTSDLRGGMVPTLVVLLGVIGFSWSLHQVVVPMRPKYPVGG